MNEQEKYIQQLAQLVGELLKGIDGGDFNGTKPIPERYTYRHLCALFKLSNILDNGIQLYKQLYDLIIESGKAAVREKFRNGEKIRVAFLAISAAEWPAEEVYQLMEKDPRYESYIVVCPLVDRDKNDMEQVYRQTYHFFEKSGHQVKKVYDEKAGVCLSWEQIGGVPDIVIHLNPWYEALPQEYWIESFPLRCLNAYIPYSFYVLTSADGNYGKTYVYNKEFVNMMWRVYTDSEQNFEGYQSYELLQGKNVFYSGYTKMDYFFQKKEYSEKAIKEIWKIPDSSNAKEMKKLIIAPHHSFENYGGIALSTFHKNKYFLLYLAQKYKDTISFILKPHPNLRARSVEARVFGDFAAYDAYLEQWNLLPNAKVVEEADYRDIFATSDGMIMDCGSFLAEYMYVNKPLLFLRKKEQGFTDLGKKLLDCYYQASGEDYLGIEEFVAQVILSGNDTMQEKRRKVFEEELNYQKKNNCMASESIYQDISKLLQ